MLLFHNIMVKIHNIQKIKILKFLLSNKTREFTIRELSRQLSVDYKTIYLNIQQLIEEEIIISKRAGQTVLCSIDLRKFNQDIFNAEFSRRLDILGNKDIYVLFNRISEIKSPFFTLLVFGSYASGKQRKGSDIDIMLISDDLAITKEIKDIISTIPLKIHFIDFSSKEFLSMLKTTEFNVGKETFNNNVLLFGIEDYYRLIQNA